MTYILLVILTLSSPNKESKEIEIRIPYSNKEKCLKASEKIDFSFKFPGTEIISKSKCILKDSEAFKDNLET